MYHAAQRVPGLLSLLRGADANLVPHREVVHSQEKLGMVEVLVLQIPYPLQRFILPMKRVSVGSVGCAGTWNCAIVSGEDPAPAGGSRYPMGGMVKRVPLVSGSG